MLLKYFIVKKAVPELPGKVTIDRSLNTLEASRSETDNYANGLPRRDSEGNIIAKSAWDLVMKYPLYSCPCGIGLQYKRCHGK